MLQKRRLENETNVVTFSTKINPQTEKVTITFADTKEKQEFNNFSTYLYYLSYYYRKRLDAEGNDVMYQVDICETFLNILYMYMTDMRGFIKDKDKFNQDIHMYIEQFEYFKKQYLQSNNVETTPNGKTSLAVREKIIILEYIGMLEILEEKVPIQETRAQFLSKLLATDFDNLRKYIRNRDVNRGIKNEKRLTNIIELAKELGFSELKNKAQADLDKINKKKG